MFYEIEDKKELEELLKNENNIKKFKDSLPKDFPFYKILDSLTFCKPKVHVASDEFKKLTEQLKLERDNKVYREMTKEVDSSQRYGKVDLMSDFGKELKEVNRQGIAIFNTLITVGGSFAFGFYGITFMYPGLNLTFEARLIIGLIIATIVFFADLYFIIKGMDGKEVKRNVKQYKKRLYNEKGEKKSPRQKDTKKNT